MRKIFTLTLSLLLFVLAACGTDETEDSVVTVSAAASLKDAMDEIIEKYNETNDVEIDVNSGGSGALREQIINGAPVDIFISASEADFDMVKDDGKVIESDDLLKNRLVLIQPNNGNLENIEDLNDVETLSIGEIETVPAGQYAKESLTNLDMFDELEDNIIYASDVRAVLTYVAQDEVDAGIVYETDAKIIDDVEIIDVFDEDLHAPIIYPAGLLTEDEDAKAFYDYLKSDEALQIFEKYGFTIE